MQQAPDLPLDRVTTAPAQAELGALALVTLDPAKYVTEVFAPFRNKLDALKVEADAVEFDVATTAGMATAVKYRAAFRDDVRVAGEKIRQQRKAPILEIGRLLDSKYKELATEVAPYEERFDSAIKSEEKRKADEKAEKERIERERIAAIRAKIDAILELPAKHAGENSTDLTAALTALAQRTTTAEEFSELAGEAAMAVDTVAAALMTMRDKAAEAEAVALAAEEARKAEAARIEAERAELAKLRAEQAERERIAKIESDRIAAEQVRAAAELEAAQDKLAAEQAAHEARLQLERDHADGLEINARGHYFSTTTFRDDGKPIMCNPNGTRSIFCDVDEGPDDEAERTRLQSIADQHLVDNRLPAPESVSVLDAMIDEGAGLELSDDEIIEQNAVSFGLSPLEAVERLAAIDFAAARERYKVAA